MNHIMIDLETLGTGHDAAVLQIGAVAFGEDSPTFEHDPDARFAADIDLLSALRYGNVDHDTLDWWRKQHTKAPTTGTEPLDSALIRLRDWIQRQRSRAYPLVWSRGSMDIEILTYQYPLVLGQPQPWLFYDVRDARTLDTVEVLLGQVPPKAPRDDRHDAYADAAHQARRALAVFAALRDAANARASA